MQEIPLRDRHGQVLSWAKNDWKDTPKVVLATEEYGRGKNYRFWQANHTH